MTIKPIRNEADYDAALDAIDDLMGAAPNTSDADTLEVLVTLAEAYEARRWPIEAPDSGLDDRACHGGAWLAPKGLGRIDRIAATRIGGPRPTPSLDAADDSRPVARMEAAGRHARRRV